VVAVVAGRGRPGDRVLDLGCGTGTYAVALATAGFDVVGMDFAPAMLRRSAAKATEAGVLGASLQLVQADFNRGLPYDSEFDHVLCVCALQCVDDPAAFFAGARRALKPNGRFVLVALAGRPGDAPSHRLQTTLARRGFWWMKRRMAKGRRWARYSPDLLAAMLAEAGFAVERVPEHPRVLLARRAETSS
jgi:ubiquinone/menaquinone biosynthesis C-methylase UbiE